GCDICQQVCPVNLIAVKRLRQRGQFGVPGERAMFQPREVTGSSPALIPLLRLDDEGFRDRFRHSPVKRAKRRGLLRNVCVALGNIGDPAAIPALADALHDAEPLVRGHAAWALGRIGGDDARTALECARSDEMDATVMQEIRCALAMFGVDATEEAGG
ncbi:MAG TPA: HEAT repeat domain-containing protein, partial [Ktedonobacterales bacterium]|nr:HEAT repeat domain-containing protein [Ktedonobacterales bacterium]